MNIEAQASRNQNKLGVFPTQAKGSDFSRPKSILEPQGTLTLCVGQSRCVKAARVDVANRALLDPPGFIPVARGSHAQFQGPAVKRELAQIVQAEGKPDLGKTLKGNSPEQSPLPGWNLCSEPHYQFLPKLLGNLFDPPNQDPTPH